MLKNVIASTISGVICAAKLLCEYPKFDRFMARFDYYTIQTNGFYKALGFPILGLLLGVISTFLVWLVSILFGAGIVGALVGALLALFLIEGKNSFSSMLYISSYISTRIRKVPHAVAIENLSNDLNQIKSGIECIVLTLLLDCKFIMYVVIIYKQEINLLASFFILDYTIQALLVSNQTLNKKILFELKQRELDIFYLVSIILLFIGVQFSFENTVIVIMVFLAQWLIISRTNNEKRALSFKYISLIAGFSELALGVIWLLRLL